MGRTRLRDGPDMGWSWIVASAACFCNFLLSGILRTYNVSLNTLINVFDVTLEEASWSLIICACVLKFTGPLSGLLCQNLGVRPVVMAGALIGAVGLSSCFFISSFNTMIWLFGVVFGIGYGLVNTLLPVIVNIYFLNLRSTANGIAYSGSCFGYIILPVLFEYLIDNYGIHGCFLLSGGIVLNVSIAGAIMRQALWVKQKVPEEENIPLVVKRPAENQDVPKSIPLIISDRKLSVSSNNIHSNCSDDKIEYEGDLDPNSDPQRELQAELLRTLNRRSEFQSGETNTLESFPEKSYDSIDTSVSSFGGRRDDTLYKENDNLLRAQKEFEDSVSDFESVVVDIEITSKSDELLNRIDPSEVKTSQLTDSCPARHSFSISSAKRSPNRFRSPIPSAGPLKKHSFRASSEDFNNFELYPLRENNKKEIKSTEESQSVPDSKIDAIPECTNQESSEDINANSKSEKTVGGFRSFIIVITSPLFYLTSLVNISFCFLFHVFVNIIVNYSLDHGIPDRDAKDVLLSLVICDLFGRLCLGWITDKKYISRSYFVMICLGGIAVILFALPFATDYWSLVMLSGCYGILSGCTMVLFPILLVDYLGITIHAVAYGCMCFLNGFIPFIRPQLIGYFRDILGSYENMFFVLSAISFVTSAAWMFEKCFLPKEDSPLINKSNTGGSS